MVGDFLYRRVAGIEAIEGGYKCFSVRPVLGGGLTYAKASVKTPYGLAASEWHLENGKFTIKVTVPRFLHLPRDDAERKTNDASKRRI